MALFKLAKGKAHAITPKLNCDITQETAEAVEDAGRPPDHGMTDAVTADDAVRLRILSRPEGTFVPAFD